MTLLDRWLHLALALGLALTPAHASAGAGMVAGTVLDAPEAGCGSEASCCCAPDDDASGEAPASPREATTWQAQRGGCPCAAPLPIQPAPCLPALESSSAGVLFALGTPALVNTPDQAPTCDLPRAPARAPDPLPARLAYGVRLL